MIKLVFPQQDLSELVQAFRANELESFAFILARPALSAPKGWRLLVNSIHLPEPEDYEIRSKTLVRPGAAFRLRIEKQARREGLALIYCHSHPRDPGIPSFSALDDETEKPLAAYSRKRVGEVPHVALLIGAEGVRARELGGAAPVEVFEIGRRVIRHFPVEVAPVAEQFDRQVRAFGEEGQRAIQALRVAIVGLGGTGSVIAQQLAHLGVCKFLLIDPDTLDKTNRNRVVGILKGDVGRAKVLIARRMIKQLVSNAEVTVKQGDVLEKDTGMLLTGVDFIFCCTDSHGSRHFINQLAYQYFIPCIDMGVVITTDGGRVTHFGGRTHMLAPGLSCLVCTDGVLSPQEVRWDLSNERQRAADPYFSGRANITQPAVISLNSTVASHAVTMFLAAVAGIPTDVRSQLVRGIPGITRALATAPRKGCITCSKDAYYGKGALHELPCRAA
jgi:hypothetical protein